MASLRRRHLLELAEIPNWDSVLREIALETSQPVASAFDRVRRKHLAALHQHTGRNVIAYYSGFLTKPRIEGSEITDEDKNGFMLAIHQLERSTGLDLILHTSGGSVTATDSLIHYLRQMFGRDIRVIVPQIAMSAGTMIACSARSIVMGKHSNLGPVDPQFGGIPAIGVLAEIRLAYDEISKDARYADVWSPILSRLTPSFVQQCHWAIEQSRRLVTEALGANMFADLEEPERGERVAAAVAQLTDLSQNKAHDRHFHLEDCQRMGLVIEPLELDATLQDKVLTLHHCYMHTLSNSAAYKIIENHLGRAMVRSEQVLIAPQSLSLAQGLRPG